MRWCLDDWMVERSWCPAVAVASLLLDMAWSASVKPLLANTFCIAIESPPPLADAVAAPSVCVPAKRGTDLALLSVAAAAFVRSSSWTRRYSAHVECTGFMVRVTPAPDFYPCDACDFPPCRPA
eukprot:1928640-Rhodomonas_salina.10